MTATLLGNRFRVVEPIFGDARLGLVRALDLDGRRCLVSVVDRGRAPAIPRVLGEARWCSPLCAPILFAHEDPAGFELLVEEEPPGLPSVWAPPLAPRALRDGALALARLLAASPPGAPGIRPEVVYVDGGRLSGIAPRFFALWERSIEGETRSGRWTPFDLVYLSSEELRGGARSRVHDLYALGTMIAYLSSGAPPYFKSPDEALVQFLVRVVQGSPRLADDGPFADVIADCLRARPLDEIIARLEELPLDEAEAAHATRARLVADVVAHPDDDGPRLVLADWLVERGDPRGELIQLQCAARPSEALAARADELVAAHGLRWGAHLLPDAYTWSFERGFVSTVSRCDPAALDRRRAALLAHGPLPRYSPTAT
jgi:uncharacterized protein (TIGR02996 family)